MPARFEIRRAFPVQDRALFVLAGTIREGMVQAGMTARLEGAEEEFQRPVHGVEFLEPEGGTESEADSGDEGDGGGGGDASGDALPCLTFYCRDRERLEEWMSRDWEGETLRLGW